MIPLRNSEGRSRYLISRDIKGVHSFRWLYLQDISQEDQFSLTIPPGRFGVFEQLHELRDKEKQKLVTENGYATASAVVLDPWTHTFRLAATGDIEGFANRYQVSISENISPDVVEKLGKKPWTEWKMQRATETETKDVSNTALTSGSSAVQESGSPVRSEQTALEPYDSPPDNMDVEASATGFPAAQETVSEVEAEQPAFTEPAGAVPQAFELFSFSDEEDWDYNEATEKDPDSTEIEGGPDPVSYPALGPQVLGCLLMASNQDQAVDSYFEEAYGDGR